MCFGLLSDGFERPEIETRVVRGAPSLGLEVSEGLDLREWSLIY
jgi:hypothetical protein